MTWQNLPCAPTLPAIFAACPHGWAEIEFTYTRGNPTADPPQDADCSLEVRRLWGIENVDESALVDLIEDLQEPPLGMPHRDCILLARMEHHAGPCGTCMREPDDEHRPGDPCPRGECGGEFVTEPRLTACWGAYRSAKSPFGHKRDADDSRDDGPPMPPPAPPEYPPVDEVARLWAQCRGVDEHPGVAAWLASRGLDADRLSQPREVPMCRALQQYAQAGHPTLSPGQRQWMPRWASIGSEKLTPWTDTGYQVLIPCYDAAGVMRSFRARWIHPGDPPAAKAIPPRGFEARGLVMANIAGLWLLREGSWPAELAEHHRQLWIVEGEPDTLTIASAIPATRSCHRAVWGVYNGSWTAELAARVPDNADVVLGIHDDEAGRKYRDKVDRTLHGRVRLRVHVPKKPREA